jgi:hypothetical protein
MEWLFGSAKLAFNATQLKEVLHGFIKFFQSEECLDRLVSLAPNEEKMLEYIENTQEKIFHDHNIDGKRGLQELKNVQKYFGNDPTVMDLLMFVAQKEESLFDFSVSLAANRLTNEQKEYQLKLLALSYDEYSAKKKAISQSPEMREQFQQVFFQQLALLPEDQRKMALDTLNISPEQKQQILLALSTETSKPNAPTMNKQ